MRLSFALSATRSSDSPSLARGSILLEVILALALFVTTAAIVTSGMNASADSLDRQRLNTHAANLAATALAEVQLGIRSPTAAGEQPFAAPFEKWTVEIVAAPTEAESGGPSGLLRVEVIIRHQDASMVRRLAQIVRIPRGADTLVRNPDRSEPADRSVRLTRVPAAF